MSSLEYTRAIESELVSLNERIDRKIMRGLDYSDEARRHKMLRAQMRKVRLQRKTSTFSSQMGQFMRFASFL